MKKILSVALVLSLLFIGAGVGFSWSQQNSGTVNYKSMAKAYDPAQTVATVDGRDVSWGEYYYWFSSYAQQMEAMFKQYETYYGIECSWSDPIDEESGETYAEQPAAYADDILRQYAAAEKYAEANGIAITAEDADALDALKMDSIAGVCEDPTSDAAFESVLAELYMPRATFDRMIEDNYLSQKCITEIFGDNGEKTDAADVAAFLADQGYMRAMHVLLMTIDRDTGETVSQDELREKQAKATEISEELRAIKSDEERFAKFSAFLAELNEDEGMTIFPSGYTFLPGTMVPVFESAVAGLKEYEVSEPVESSYGYHVIIRLPLDADEYLYEYYMNNQQVTGRLLYASTTYNTSLDTCYHEVNLEYADGFNVPDINRYVR